MYSIVTIFKLIYNLVFKIRIQYKHLSYTLSLT